VGLFFNLKRISNVQYMLKNSTQQFMCQKKSGTERVWVRGGNAHTRTVPVPISIFSVLAHTLFLIFRTHTRYK